MILPCHRWQSRRSWVYLKLWLKAYISLGENNEGEFQSVTKFVVYGLRSCCHVVALKIFHFSFRVRSFVMKVDQDEVKISENQFRG